MRWILAVEYEYVRVYVYSIVLQAVIERRRKEKLHQVTKSRGEKVNAKTLMYCMTAYISDISRMPPDHYCGS
jgi:hypothetical protein